MLTFAGYKQGKDQEILEMANCITLGRLILLFVLVYLTYQDYLAAQIAAFMLLITIFAMDGLDGWVARKRGECTLFGSVFDIAADRVVENVLWVVLAHLARVPLWVALIFLLRGFLVDAIRSVENANGRSSFDALTSPLSQFLVAGRLMRGVYGTVKTLAFAWLYLVPLMYAVWPVAVQGQLVFNAISNALIFAAVLLCIVRAVPVIAEFTVREGVFSRNTMRRESTRCSVPSVRSRV